MAWRNGRARMCLSILELAHIRMGIPIEDLDLGRRTRIPENDHRTSRGHHPAQWRRRPRQFRGQDFSEVSLVRLHIAGNLQVTQVAGMAQQVFHSVGPGIRSEVIESIAQGLRAERGAHPAAVAPDSLLGGKAEEDGPGSIGPSQSPSQQATKSRIVGRRLPQSHLRRADARHQPQPTGWYRPRLS